VKDHICILSDLKNNNSDLAISTGTTKILRLGQMLHVALVIASPINSDKKDRTENISKFPLNVFLHII
jgi:hypothetical protein